MAPATSPKKASVAGRGIPPPIPPNKPVIPTKQTTARRPDSGGDADKKKPIVGSKEQSNLGSIEQGRATSSGIEMLGQELADFQQMFVTMATSNST